VLDRVKQTSIDQMQYMVNFIDDFSRYIWVYFLKEKAVVLSKFKAFRAKVEGEPMHEQWGRVHFQGVL